MDKRPIGVFDSGLGGITAVRELKNIMPNENIIYFGDTSRVPYGTRSKETIRKYSAQDIKFLLGKDVKMIVAACGTVSTNIDKDITCDLPVHFTGVLQPAVTSACKSTKNKKIGIIATSATIKTRAYETEIRKIIPEIEIAQNACHMFVPLIENGYIDRNCEVTKIIANEYLKPIVEKGVDTLILGCTHYPIIKDLIQDIVSKDTTLIDPGVEVANYVKEYLTSNNMLNNSKKRGHCKFFVSDNIESFQSNASVFLDENISGEVEIVDIDKY